MAVVTKGEHKKRSDGEQWLVRSETVDPRQTGGARLARRAFSKGPQRASRLWGPRRARLRGGVPLAEQHATARRRVGSSRDAVHAQRGPMKVCLFVERKDEEREP